MGNSQPSLDLAAAWVLRSTCVTSLTEVGPLSPKEYSLQMGCTVTIFQLCVHKKLAFSIVTKSCLFALGCEITTVAE